MNAINQELFDLAILRLLDANRTRWGLPVGAISHLMAQFSFPSPKEDLLLDRIDYLVNKGLIEEVLKVVNKANRAWRLTEAGINYVDNHP